MMQRMEKMCSIAVERGVAGHADDVHRDTVSRIDDNIRNKEPR